MPRRLLGILMLLLVSVPVWPQGEVVLLRIGNQNISKAEFESYHTQLGLASLQESLVAFIDKKVMSMHARELCLDTLLDFRMLLTHYRRHNQEQGNKQQKASVWKSYARRGGAVMLESITWPLSQHSERSEETRAKQWMDSLYAELKNGMDMAVFLRDYDGEKIAVREEWVVETDLLQEWQEALQKTGKNIYTSPFYSPSGIHIIRQMDYRSPVADELVYGGYEWSIIEEELLSVLLMQRAYTSMEHCSEKELETHFQKHRSDYEWELPHYRGAVIHGKSSKEVKRIRKRLKKLPFSKMKVAVLQLNEEYKGGICIDCGLFEIGENKFVDKLVFKCGEFDPLADYPYVQVVGKKLKHSPEYYWDVEEKVVKDCLEQKKSNWLDSLRRKYEIEWDEDVLKTVNNDRTK